MFYEEENPTQSYRLGDILKGYILAAADIEEPSTLPIDYQICVARPKFLVVLTPCCSIADRTLTLAPLTKLTSGLLRNPHLVTDFARINRPMLHREALAPGRWDKMREDERAQCLAEDSKGPGLHFLHFFVYQPSERLGSYQLQGQTVGYHVVDFRQMHKAECAKVTRKSVPMDAKVLQLSIEARGLLRKKLIEYFGRPAPEDEA